MERLWKVVDNQSGEVYYSTYSTLDEVHEAFGPDVTAELGRWRPDHDPQLRQDPPSEETEGSD